MKLMNDLVPADIYLSELAPVDLQRDLSLCQLCPLVDCKSKKLDTIDKNSRYQFLFLFDQFAMHQLDEEHMERLQVVLAWLQLHPSYGYFTSVMKCSEGDVVNCEQYLKREIALINPQTIFLFTETYSFLHAAPIFYQPMLYQRHTYIELPHPRFWLAEQDYHYVYHAMLTALKGGA